MSNNKVITIPQIQLTREAFGQINFPLCRLHEQPLNLINLDTNSSHNLELSCIQCHSQFQQPAAIVYEEICASLNTSYHEKESHISQKISKIKELQQKISSLFPSGSDYYTLKQLEDFQQRWAEFSAFARIQQLFRTILQPKITREVLQYQQQMLMRFISVQVVDQQQKKNAVYTIKYAKNSDLKQLQQDYDLFVGEVEVYINILSTLKFQESQQHIFRMIALRNESLQEKDQEIEILKSRILKDKKQIEYLNKKLGFGADLAMPGNLSSNPVYEKIQFEKPLVYRFVIDQEGVQIKTATKEAAQNQLEKVALFGDLRSYKDKVVAVKLEHQAYMFHDFVGVVNESHYNKYGFNFTEDKENCRCGQYMDGDARGKSPIVSGKAFRFAGRDNLCSMVLIYDGVQCILHLVSLQQQTDSNKICSWDIKNVMQSSQNKKDVIRFCIMSYSPDSTWAIKN